MQPSSLKLSPSQLVQRTLGNTPNTNGNDYKTGSSVELDSSTYFVEPLAIAQGNDENGIPSKNLTTRKTNTEFPSITGKIYKFNGHSKPDLANIEQKESKNQVVGPADILYIEDNVRRKSYGSINDGEDIKSSLAEKLSVDETQEFYSTSSVEVPPTFLQKYANVFLSYPTKFALCNCTAAGIFLGLGAALCYVFRTPKSSACTTYTSPDGSSFEYCNLDSLFNYIRGLQDSLKNAKSEVGYWKNESIFWKDTVSEGNAYMGDLSNSISNCTFQPVNCSMALMPTDLKYLYESGDDLNKNSKALSDYVRNNANNESGDDLNKNSKALSDYVHNYTNKIIKP